VNVPRPRAARWARRRARSRCLCWLPLSPDCPRHCSGPGSGPRSLGRVQRAFRARDGCQLRDAL